ncbi:SIR2 family protein [Paraburkholderia caribensis]|uniref:SIR2 family NAD-dependent protein deacylase n=1 Tax=Paraburkholderia TaxID=1822464 RepID=UPI001CAADED4|nr:SIR2 family protein [Paraburkholderia caribensis]BEU25785.1 SIR2 family protein [Paraburkholderia sp. 22B1P]CAG9250855.1 SIR2_2 domain-containing protein [Paraburkholderia caribensis]
MSAFFEIAYAAASNRLCIFTGTGFSKAITSNEAPSWMELLKIACDSLPDGDSLKNALFPDDEKNQLSLEEAAQVIAIQYASHGKNLHSEVADIIRKLTPSGDNSVISDFLKNNPVKVVTTNYDKLVEQLAGKKNCHSLAPGMPIPRSEAATKIYHVHGSVDSPPNMVVTSDDYFKFINGESYFSRKLSTVLHENTVVILGYSLGDTNLKAILSDYRGFSRSHVIGGNIFLVSRGKIDQYVKDYYSYCYGIRVLDGLGVHDFFSRINDSMDTARERAKSSVSNITKVLFEDRTYKDDYLKVESSFFEIVASVAAIGKSINDPLVVAVFGKVLEKKIELTGANGAWEQYEHLARWLIYLGTILELEGTSVERIYLEAVLTSMNGMSKKLTYGYSWYAYRSWDSGWSSLIAANRTLIRRYVTENTADRDALEIVERG